MTEGREKEASSLKNKFSSLLSINLLLLPFGPGLLLLFLNPIMHFVIEDTVENRTGEVVFVTPLWGAKGSARRGEVLVNKYLHVPSFQQSDFRVWPNSSITLAYDFEKGSHPTALLIRDTRGILYHVREGERPLKENPFIIKDLASLSPPDSDALDAVRTGSLTWIFWLVMGVTWLPWLTFFPLYRVSKATRKGHPSPPAGPGPAL